MRHLSARRCARPNERSNPPLKSMTKLLAHEDTVITGFGTASRLFIADRRVEALILHHCLMRQYRRFPRSPGLRVGPPAVRVRGGRGIAARLSRNPALHAFLGGSGGRERS